MRQVLKVEQGTTQWLKLKSRYLSATDANLLKNRDNWEAILREKMTPDFSGKRFVSRAMKKGIEREPEARSVFSADIGTPLTPVCVVDRNLGAMCSLDAANDNCTYIVEIKCPEKDECSDLYIDAARLKIPSTYRDQMQFQMMVTGLSNNNYCVYVGNRKYQHIHVERDEIQIRMFKNLCQEFWVWAEQYVSNHFQNLKAAG